MTTPKEATREALPQLFVLEGRQVHKGDVLHVNPAYHARAGTTVKAEYPAGSGWAVCRSDNGAVPDLPIEALSWTPHPDSEDREAIARATNRHGAQVTDRDLEMFRCGRESERQAHAAEIAGLRVKAARYDWLRQYPNNLDGRVYGPTYSKEGGGLLRRDTHLDAAIDAARAVSKQGEES